MHDHTPMQPGSEAIIGFRVPGAWVPYRKVGDRAIYRDTIRKNWIITEGGVTKVIFPMTDSGGDAATVALYLGWLKGLETWFRNIYWQPMEDAFQRVA